MTFTFESFEMRRRAIAFADVMFGVADTLPARPQVSVREQLRRAALSIPINLAKGCVCEDDQERSDFYHVAKSAVHEVVSLLMLSGNGGHLSQDIYRQHYETADQIVAMITDAMT